MNALEALTNCSKYEGKIIALKAVRKNEIVYLVFGKRSRHEELICEVCFGQGKGFLHYFAHLLPLHVNP